MKMNIWVLVLVSAQPLAVGDRAHKFPMGDFHRFFSVPQSIAFVLVSKSNQRGDSKSGQRTIISVADHKNFEQQGPILQN
jgi:hypothetical protein